MFYQIAVLIEYLLSVVKRKKCGIKKKMYRSVKRDRGGGGRDENNLQKAVTDSRDKFKMLDSLFSLLDRAVLGKVPKKIKKIRDGTSKDSIP